MQQIDMRSFERMHMGSPTYNVALLCGGNSGEKEISKASGKSAAQALRTAGCAVTVLDPANRETLTTLLNNPFDVAFLCLHGKGGEDGTIQGFLEYAQLPYTGPGVLASALAMDKSRAKAQYISHNLPTPHSQTLFRGHPYDVDALARDFGFPCVVKATTEGSALGVYIVHSKEEMDEKIAACFAMDDHILVEQFIKGTELTVAVLGNDEPFALPVIEIIPKHAFYDFESKYAPAGSQHICPARLSEQDTKAVQDLAVRAHRALGCSGMSRTDILRDERGAFWLLETNTIPGMTQTSLLPDAARVYGLDFPTLCMKLIELALDAKANK